MQRKSCTCSTDPDACLRLRILIRGNDSFPWEQKTWETGILQAIRLVRIRGGIGSEIALEVSFLVDITLLKTKYVNSFFVSLIVAV